MRQVLLAQVPRARRAALGARLLLASLAWLVAGCASHSLMPEGQANAVKHRDRALARHAGEIQTAIQQSGRTGALAFLDAGDGRLVVLPGDTPSDAWARHAAGPESGAGRVSVPPVILFVYRADVAAAPEAVNSGDLQRVEALRRSLAELETMVRDAERRTEERLGEIRRELADSLALAKGDTDKSLAAERADVERALRSLGDDLAAARTFMLQTAQLGWLNHELNVENASSIRKVETTSHELAESSARLAATVQQLSGGLTRQLKELAERLESLRSKMSELK